MIFDLLKDLNKEDSFTNMINESSYIEKINTISNTISNTSNHYNNFVTCIVSEYDPFYSNIPDNEKDMYMKKRIVEICSEIEENSVEKYENFRFNKKTMKIPIIQYGLQMWVKKENYISSIYYLNEYYQKHFVIVYENKMYETCLKDYPKIYLIYLNGMIMIGGNKDNNLEYCDLNDLFDKINLKNDIKKDKKSVYQMKLDPISKYKLDDLKELSKECNLGIKDGLKNKTKKVLYDEINLYYLNH